MDQIENNDQSLLRIASHSSHVVIYRHPLLIGLTSHNYSLTTCQVVLAAYYHLFEKLEKIIYNFVSKYHIPVDYSFTSKLVSIKDDLNYFNEDRYYKFNLPTKPIEFPVITSIGQLIGVLFAIEGGIEWSDYLEQSV